MSHSRRTELCADYATFSCTDNHAGLAASLPTSGCLSTPFSGASHSSSLPSDESPPYSPGEWGTQSVHSIAVIFDLCLGRSLLVRCREY